MTENAPEATEAPAQAAEEQPKPAETDWQAEARKWEKRAKDNFAQVNELKPLADQFRTLEEASKSELQRQTEALEAAREASEKAQRDALRYRVALDHGLTSEDITRLGGQSEDELKANAEWLAGIKAAAAPQAPTPVPQRPTENLRPGATPSGQLSEEDALYEQVYGSTNK
jgi:hypothetical protein